MFSAIRTYAPENVFLTFGGAVVEGWNSMTVTRQVPVFRSVKGIRGKNTRVRDTNSASTIEIICDATSMTNQIFQMIVEADTVSGAGRIELTLTDNSGFEVFYSGEAFITGPAERGYGSEVGDRKWTIECLNSRWGDQRAGIIENIFNAIF